MDQDLFGETQYSTEKEEGVNNVADQQQDDGFDYSANQNAQDDQFEFAQTSSPSRPQENGGSSGNTGYNYGSNANEDDQAIIRMREQQQKIQEKLRDKANQQYENKKKRKQEGHRQLQEFLQKKQQQKQARKSQNLEKEKKAKQQRSELNNEAGWKKVGANVALKQGQHPGKKDTNRMREAIINKKND